MPVEICLVSYPEGVAALITARKIEQTQLLLNMVMHKITGWMGDHGLSFALSETGNGSDYEAHLDD